MSCYILGTGLSHDGSACLLKDGNILVAIEKERLSRIKHDGGNDLLAVQYCLDTAGVKAEDLALIVQAANFEIDIEKHRYHGARYFHENLQVPVVTLSHHLAHAWSAASAAPFEECNVMVLDGAGSPFGHCMDLDGAVIPPQPFDTGLFCEKDSFYHFDGHTLKPLFKDFSEVRLFEDSPTVKLPTNYHSIGGLYSAASFYCFGNMDDAGKLMGLAPYGKLAGKPSLFSLSDSRVTVNYESVSEWFTKPSSDYQYFKNNFSYYADLARWVQDETEKAVTYLFTERQRTRKHPNIAYAGGVALNAVANKKLMRLPGIEQLFMQPAAGDNGLAIGCAWYGWLSVLGNGKRPASASPFMGRLYTDEEISTAIRAAEHASKHKLTVAKTSNAVAATAALLAEGKVVGWFQGGAEFGPRALGHRSILADPRNVDIRNHINRNIKFREDFRPFAPAVRREDVTRYFENGWDSPYMILIDDIKPEWRSRIPAVVHVDGTCRVQTVTADWNGRFYDLIGAFEELTGIGVLLNTSLNKKGMPIVETPLQAIELFLSGAMDVLVIENFIIYKKRTMICYAKLNLAVNLPVLQQQVVQMLQNQVWVLHLNSAHYQGNWTTLPLRSPGGNANKPFAELLGGEDFADTPLMIALPEIAAILKKLHCKKLSVRLLNLSAGAIIKEHKDLDLAFEKGEARLHIPIYTNSRVEFHVEDDRVMMNEGECWYINANLPHRVANHGETDRIHLVIDCLVNDWLKQLFAKAEQKNRQEIKNRDTQLQIILNLRLQNNANANALADQLELELEPDHQNRSHF